MNIKRISTLLIAALVAPITAVAQDDYSSLVQTPSPVMQWGLLILGITIVWLGCYKALYPFLLRHYKDPDHCKKIFWLFFGMYSYLCLAISAYKLFEFGFHYPWFTWISIFFAALWSIFFLILVLLHNEPA